jgi:osmotically-inducible protein OsmY
MRLLQLGGSKQVFACDIKVETRLGEVTLTGQVPSKQIKDVAGALAQATLGLTHVHSKLDVNPSAGQTVGLPRQ